MWEFAYIMRISPIFGTMWFYVGQRDGKCLSMCELYVTMRYEDPVSFAAVCMYDKVVTVNLIGDG